MATYGKMEEYTKEFSYYMERLEFFTANDIENSSENAGNKKAKLLSVIGSKAYGCVRYSFAPIRLTDKSSSEIVEVFKNPFQPK